MQTSFSMSVLWPLSGAAMKTSSPTQPIVSRRQKWTGKSSSQAASRNALVYCKRNFVSTQLLLGLRNKLFKERKQKTFLDFFLFSLKKSVCLFFVGMYVYLRVCVCVYTTCVQIRHQILGNWSQGQL